ncbi:HlyD family secretion protein [Serratia sp. L9]|uniref:HlyD family secretion protein n=1 Tax=Serratia sp. L9 TaxID=3423946 RepID=UPI003D664AA0
MRSQLERARSAAKLAESQLGRYQQLYASLAISAAEWEKFKQDHVQKVAQVKELTHQLAAKELPARQAQINNQTLRAESSRFKWDKARWDLQQSLIVAPQDGRVYDVIYRPGERPLAGKPIISLLPPGNIKIRFFVAQKNLGALHIGQTIKASCDGCQQPIVGTINYISPQAEYTPPVIYSTARREKLVFMVEAVPMTEQADMIKIGQPVEVGVMADE